MDLPLLFLHLSELRSTLITMTSITACSIVYPFINIIVKPLRSIQQVQTR